MLAVHSSSGSIRIVYVCTSFCASFCTYSLSFSFFFACPPRVCCCSYFFSLDPLPAPANPLVRAPNRLEIQPAMCKQIASSYGISRCSNTFPIDKPQLKCSRAGATSSPSTQIRPGSSPNSNSSNSNNNNSFPLPHCLLLRRRLSLRHPILQPLAALWPRPFPRITPPTLGTAQATDRGHPVVISTSQTS